MQGKANTHGIERNNGQQRHWFLRFKRKSIAPSRSLEMINLTMALFAAYHVNKTLKLPCILDYHSLIFQPNKESSLRLVHQFIPQEAIEIVYLYHQGFHS